MEAVVMAAGEGRRLRPLTERWAKPILPVAGRPVAATLLHELALARPERVTVVTGHLGGQVETLLGDGSAFGVALRYVRQPEPLGSADAVARALSAGARPPLLVTAADTVFAPGDLARASERWLASGADGGLAVRPAADPRDRTPVRVEAGRLVGFGGPGDAALHAAPAWFLDGGLAASLADVPGPPFELASAFEAALAAGKTLLALAIGPTRDLTRPDDLVAANFPYLWGRP